MTKRSVRRLPIGLYRLFWKGGGSSLAAVGMTASGDRWVAPANWVTPAVDGRPWRMVERLTLIRRARIDSGLS